MPLWIREKLFQRDLLVKELRRAGADKAVGERLRFAEHHVSHAASALGLSRSALYRRLQRYGL